MAKNGKSNHERHSGRPRGKKKGAEAPATPAPGEAAGTTAASNSAIRAEIQRKAFAKRWDLDREIAAQQARHVKPLQEEKNRLWKDARNDLGMEAADLNPLYAVYKRDRQVSEFDDADKAARLQDSLREGFQTLASGKTLNFLDVLGGQLFGQDGTAREANGDEPPEMQGGLIETNGYNAGHNGWPSTNNPWPEGSPSSEAWHRGWLNGQTAKVHETLGGQAPAEAQPTA